MDVETIIMIKAKKKFDLDFSNKVYSNVHSFKICLATFGKETVKENQNILSLTYLVIDY